MCFSNLPVEFDEDGDPYLADEADAVDRPGEATPDHDPDCGCGAAPERGLDADPEGAYEAIVDSLSGDARRRVSGGTSRDERTATGVDSGRGSAEGD